jgi:hypothetical protein
MTRHGLTAFGIGTAALCTPTTGTAQLESHEPPYAYIMGIPSDSISYMVGGVIESAQTGEPLPGAQVFISGTYIGTVADRRGRFRFDAPSAGLRQIVVRLIPYQEACVNVEFFANVMQSLRIGVALQTTRRQRPDDPEDPPSVEIPLSSCIDPERVPHTP